MEENKVVETKETKNENKEGLLTKIGNWITNPAKGRFIKNVGFMAGGASLLMLAASLLTGKNDSDDDESDEDDA